VRKWIKTTIQVYQIYSWHTYWS